MTKTMKAVYENGVFKPSESPGLSDGSLVELTVRTEDPASANGSAIDVLGRLASLPLEGGPEPFSGADHDDELYGPNGAR